MFRCGLIQDTPNVWLNLLDFLSQNPSWLKANTVNDLFQTTLPLHAWNDSIGCRKHSRVLVNMSWPYIECVLCSCRRTRRGTTTSSTSCVLRLTCLNSRICVWVGLAHAHPEHQNTTGLHSEPTRPTNPLPPCSQYLTRPTNSLPGLHSEPDPLLVPLS